MVVEQIKGRRLLRGRKTLVYQLELSIVVVSDLFQHVPAGIVSTAVVQTYWINCGRLSLLNLFQETNFYR